MINLLLILLTLTAQPSPEIPCSVKEGRDDTTLTCRENGRTVRRVIPRTIYRFVDCKTVNLQRTADGKMGFAEHQTCRIIDTQEKIAECEKWQQEQLDVAGYDSARDPQFASRLVNCEAYYTQRKGEALLVPVHLLAVTRGN